MLPFHQVKGNNSKDTTPSDKTCQLRVRFKEKEANKAMMKNLELYARISCHFAQTEDIWLKSTLEAKTGYSLTLARSRDPF